MKDSNTNQNERPTVHFMAGLPGLGKSTYRKSNGLAELSVVDCDRFKEKWLGDDISDVEKLQASHLPSKACAARHFALLLATGKDFVVDGTGTSTEAYLNQFQQARECGFTVKVHYVEVSKATSILRNSMRKRTVPVSIIEKKAEMIVQSVKVYKILADEFVKFNND